jgi:hypothetical protein
MSFASSNVDKILPALMTVKSKLQAVTKSASNPFFKSKYADLNTHLDAVEPLLADHGLVLFQPVTVESNGLNTVSSVIMHSSGQWVQSQMIVTSAANDMQKLGSAVTYARRYTLGSLLSMKAEDDDGEGSIGRGKTAGKAATEVPSGTGGDSKATPAAAAAEPRRPSFRTGKSAPAAVTTGDDL